MRWFIERSWCIEKSNVDAPTEGIEKGAAFFMRFPFNSADAPLIGKDPKVNPTDVAAPNSSDSHISFDGMRILIVDDDRNTRDMLSEILRIYEAEVKTAESVAAALRIYQSWTPTLLISDLGMPDADGYDLIRNIRALPSGFTTKAIAITGYGRNEDRDRAIAAGFNLFLSKPMDLDNLINLIDKTGRN